jgi:rhodanese-related sulfurtransferase
MRRGMPREIDREEVQRMVAAGAQLVEVLPSHEYEDDHLPGAISIPMRHLDREGTAMLDRNRPVIVYCWDRA